MEQQTGTFAVKKGLAQMLKGGVIMDVVTPEHAKIAEDAGACAVMALERVPADIRAQGGVARMSDPDLILKIMDSVTIPVMAKCRIGHFVEAQILEAIGIDYIDEGDLMLIQSGVPEAAYIWRNEFLYFVYYPLLQPLSVLLHLLSQDPQRSVRLVES